MQNSQVEYLTHFTGFSPIPIIEMEVECVYPWTRHHFHGASWEVIVSAPEMLYALAIGPPNILGIV